MSEGFKGRMKEAAGAITGDEDLKAEGRALQRKAEAEKEAEQREKTRQAQAAAKQAEKELAGQRGRHAAKTLAKRRRRLVGW